jgi:hypothetical protein
MTGVGGPIGINNSTFSGNEAGNGGAMRLGSLSNLRLRNITITDNTASGLGGGIYVPPLQSVSTSNIANSILAGNSDNSASPDCFKDTDASLDFTSLGYNVFGTVTGCPIPLNTGDLTGVSDPLLGPLTDNGGPTPTHGNLEDSPAVDAGDPSGCLDSNDVEFTTDQRGEPRPLNGRCDVGAFEGIFVPPSPSPVPTESPGGGGAETESGGCAMGGSTGVDMTGFWGVLFLLSLAWGARRGMR